MNVLTKGKTLAADITALLRARNSLLWIVTSEEERIEGIIFEGAAAAGYIPRTHDVAQGIRDMDGKKPFSQATEDPAEVLRFIDGRALESRERAVWILRDFPAWLEPPIGITTLRQLKNLARKLPSVPRESAQAIVILTPKSEVPPELAGHATVINCPLPDRAEIAAILDAAIAGLPDDMQATAAPNGTRDAAIDAAIGLSGNEAASCYARSLVVCKPPRIDPLIVTNEKRRVIARGGFAEFLDPLPGGFKLVGGLQNVKRFSDLRKTAYSSAAREYGVPSPRGIALFGVSGCGKTFIAKALAAEWGVPLVRGDLGGLKSKFVGESETNVRKFFELVSAMGRCVVLFDEIEKALQGATSGASDGGVSSDALNAVLVWLQERKDEAFVIVTANDIEAITKNCPELLRKGRFDEIFFVDVPNSTERIEVLRAALAQYGRQGAAIDVESVAAKCEGFTGAEIASLVPDALFVAFNDSAREIETADLICAAASVVPLTKTAAEKIASLRAWAKERAKPATAETVENAVSSRRTLDV